VSTAGNASPKKGAFNGRSAAVILAISPAATRNPGSFRVTGAVQKTVCQPVRECARGHQVLVLEVGGRNLTPRYRKRYSPDPTFRPVCPTAAGSPAGGAYLAFASGAQARADTPVRRTANLEGLARKYSAQPSGVAGYCATSTPRP
jgi:hypothetical protein